MFMLGSGCLFTVSSSQYFGMIKESNVLPFSMNLKRFFEKNNFSISYTKKVISAYCIATTLTQ